MAAALAAIVAFLLIVPIRFPSVVSTYADVSAAHEWTLSTGVSGQLIAHAYNYQTGMSDGYRVSSFNGGSSTIFTVNPALKPGRHVAVGDLVGVVTSSELRQRLVSLQGQLAAAERSLAVNATGAKSEIVDAARERLASAKRRREDYQATVARTQSLFDDHLVPQNEYDRVMTQAHQLDDAIAISQADLATAQSGSKPEEIALAQARIVALKDEINSADQQAAGYTIRSPIEGAVSPNTSADQLLTISATTPYVARIPIRWSDFARVSTTPSARVTLIGFSRLVEGKVVSIEHEVLMRANQRVVMATALLDTPPTDLLPGASARCRIECSPMTALEYAQFIMHSISTSVDGVAN